jgi:hypothetical protein
MVDCILSYAATALMTTFTHGGKVGAHAAAAAAPVPA